MAQPARSIRTLIHRIGGYVTREAARGDRCHRETKISQTLKLVESLASLSAFVAPSSETYCGYVRSLGIGGVACVIRCQNNERPRQLQVSPVIWVGFHCLFCALLRALIDVVYVQSARRNAARLANVWREEQSRGTVHLVAPLRSLLTELNICDALISF